MLVELKLGGFKSLKKELRARRLDRAIGLVV